MKALAAVEWLSPDAATEVTGVPATMAPVLGVSARPWPTPRPTYQLPLVSAAMAGSASAPARQSAMLAIRLLDCIFPPCDDACFPKRECNSNHRRDRDLASSARTMAAPAPS